MSWKNREPDSVEEGRDDMGDFRIEKYGRVSLVWAGDELRAMTWSDPERPNSLFGAHDPDEQMVDEVLAEVGSAH